MKLKLAKTTAAWLALFAGLAVSMQTAAEIRKVEVEEIRNHSQLSGETTFAGELVGFGGATEPAAMNWLSQQGFSTVIILRLAEEENLDIENSRLAATEAGINYVHIPFDPENPAPGTVEKFLQTAADPANQPVYIHCNSGTRVAALWMIGRVNQDGLEPQQAEQEVRVIAEKPDDALNFFTAYTAAHSN